MIPAANLKFMWDNINARIGTPYTWGGTLDPNDPSAGTDCSGAVGFVIEALLYGPRMNWDRPFWTGTFAGMRPGQVAQPWGLVCISGPFAGPADAAAIVAIHQGPSADTSHMIVRVLDRTLDPDGIDIEDSSDGLQKYDRAASIDDPQFNQWFYLPGPLEQAGVLTVPLTPLANGTWTSPSPAWAHLIMRESGGNPTIIQQIIDVNSGGNEAEGLFQITPATWRAHNGTEFAATPRLATPQQQALVAARIFTRNPSGSDWGAGLAGRENAAELAAGLVPATAPPEEDFLSALSPDEQRQLFNEICGPRASRSPLRHVGEGTIGDIEDLTLNTDGSVHTLLIYLLACVLGDPDAIALLREVAGVNLARYPDRVHDSRLAQAMLNVIDGRGTASSAPITGQTPGMTPITVPPPPPPVPPKPVTVPPVAVPPTPVAVPPGGGVSSNVAQLETDVSALRQVLADLTNQIRS